MTKQVNYALEMSNTWDDLYAHVSLDNVDIGPGDEVQLHNVPVDLPFGQKKYVVGRATYLKANPLTKWWTKMMARFEITMLYEVSFSTTRFSKHTINQKLTAIQHSRRGK
jgi:hypothetical protein